MKRLALLGCLGGGLLAGLAAERQVSVPREKAVSSRFLFIIEISQSTRGLDLAIRKSLFDMLYTGLYGAMSAGDTYGVWTFNDQAHTGRFPMQVWNPDKPLEHALAATEFLKANRHEKRPNWNAVTPKLRAILQDVGDVNVVILTSPETAVTAPPFDQELQAAYAHKTAEQRKAKQPFVTALLVRHSQVASVSVSIAGEPGRLFEPIEQHSSADLAKTEATASSRGTPTDTSSQANAPSTSSGVNSNAVAAAVSPRNAIYIRNTTANPPKPGVATAKADGPPAPESGQSSILGPDATITIGAETKTASVIRSNSPALENTSNPKLEHSRAASPPTSDTASANSAGPTPSKSPPPQAAPLRPPLKVAAREMSLDPLTGSSQAIATPIAAAAAPDPTISPRTMLVVGSFILVLALVLAGIGLSRGRSSSQPSYISRSLDRS